MTVCNLSKKFGRFDAVRGFTFGVRDKVVGCELDSLLVDDNQPYVGQECFGLLGVNGAGKTTTFGMLTGDEIMSRY